MNSQEIDREFRKNCPYCKRPEQFCYCQQIRKIDSQIKFVILIHPVEARRKIATGRMAHLCLSNSVLICGYDFTDNKQVNDIIKDPKNECYLLYPKRDAYNLSEQSNNSASMFLKNQEKVPVLFIIDGTWSTANKTLKLSQNLQKLPAVCFTPQSPSRFHIRKQPAAHCYSTIESIHTILTLCENQKLKNESENILMKIFQKMVERQIEFLPKK